MSKKENKITDSKEIVRSSTAEYLTFIAATREGGVEAIYADSTIWLSQKMMGTLYNVNVRTINEHLQKIFKDNELQDDSVVRKFRITASKYLNQLVEKKLLTIHKIGKEIFYVNNSLFQYLYNAPELLKFN